MKHSVCDHIDVKALSCGSVKDFDLLYLSYYPKAKAFLTNMLGNSDDAEDLTQDVFIKLWTNRQTLHNVENLNAYVYQVVKYTLFAYVRKQKAQVTTCIDGAHDMPSTDDLEALVLGKELQQMIDYIVDQMPPQRKLIFTMSRKEGMKIEEISRTLGISRRTVETHISLALAVLRKAILSFLLLLF